MSREDTSPIAGVVRKHEKEILDEWVGIQLASPARQGTLKESELRDDSRAFLSVLTDALQSGSTAGEGKQWEDARSFLNRLSRNRAQKGFSPSETATFVFSMKQPVFSRLRAELGKDTDALASSTWAISTLLDKLGLYTTEVYQKSREDVISRQQQDMLELSTPVVNLWKGIVALPLIGTLDSARTQVVMENLLQEILSTGAETAIIDITGVPMVDTLVAQHLLKTVAAARLMGADCIISGVRPQIAQTIVHLGVELGDVATKATLADAFRLAMRRNGLTITKA